MAFKLAIMMMFVRLVASKGNTNESETNRTENDLYHLANDILERIPERFEVVALHWEAVSLPFTIVACLLLAGICEILFHIHDDVVRILPDSSLLIGVGVLVGLVLQLSGVSHAPITLDAHVFFLYLLPPIMFEAGYFMPNRALFENMGSILVFAVIGTLWNTMAIGMSLFGLGKIGLFATKFGIFEILLFSVIISCVDPIALTSVFENVGVNDFLFINVFGEALLNDGTTVILYNMFKMFDEIGVYNLTALDYALSVLSMFLVTGGGVVIGLFYAFAVSLATKYAEKVKILNPVFIFVIPYLAYLTATLFNLSAIFAIVTCGIMMKQYVKQNISESTDVSVKYFIKMLAQGSKTVVFIFFGLTTISSHHSWDTAFVVSTILFCLVYRAIGVVVQCKVLNYDSKEQKFTAVDQFVMSWGGLRGAIAFGLVLSLPDNIVAKRMFITTCIALILFTVFLQGITIRPLVNILNVKMRVTREKSLFHIVYAKYFDYMMAGLEDIAGQRGGYSWMDKFERLNARFIRPLLVRNAIRQNFDATKIVRAYNNISFTEAVELMKETRRTDEEISKKSTLQKVNRDDGEIDTAGASNGSVRRHRIPDVNEFVESERNAEMLYQMFSNLIDTKLKEVSKKSEEKAIDDDIGDDYHRDLLQKRNSTALLNLASKSQKAKLTHVKSVGHI